MSWFRWGRRDAQTPVAAPPPSPPSPRWSNPLTFQHEFPAELTGLSSVDGLLEQRIGRAQAMSVPAVKRSRDLIAGTLGTLPFQLHDSRRRTVPSDLLDQPEEDIARSVSMTHVVEDMLLEGRAWWRILSFDRNGYPAKVRRLEPRSVTVRQDAKVYVSRDGSPQGQAMEWVPDAELIRIDSPNDALLVAGARAIRSALLLDRAANRYANEPLPLGYFAPRDGMADPGTEEEIQEILDAWEQARKERAWGFVGAALEAKTLQWNPEQLQLAAARDHAVLEISRVAGIDPEDLGVSTTSRTYANAEQRRLDLLDFTLLAYVTALETRLSMQDVTPPGYRVRAQYAGFLRSDTKTRMETYKIGREVGVYDDERIAELEDIPTARPAASPAAPPAAPGPAVPPSPEGQSAMQQASTLPSLTFASDEPAVTIGFTMAEDAAAFRVDTESRTVSGMVIPWNVVAYSRGHNWMFAPGSLHWVKESRVKLDRDHEYGSELGRAVTLTNGPDGLAGAFKVARGLQGDQILGLAEDGVYDGLSASITFDAEADGWTAHPDNPSIRLVHSGTLRKVAITAMPAFDDARVASVAARRDERENPAMPDAPATPAAPPVPAAPAPAAAPAPTPDFAQFTTDLTTGLTGAVSAAIAEAFTRLPEPQGRQVVPAGRAVITREAPVYNMNGNGHSMVRDAWKARTENDSDARERLARFAAQTNDAAEQAVLNAQFAVTTGNAAAVVPPGYRPDLYVTQLMQGRPLVSSVSRGTLTDATPFTLPSFTSATGATGDHVENVNPAGGTLTIGTVTVTPGGISGLFELTREIVDSSNPAVDAIAMQAMQESYSQQTEAKLYAELNGANGQGGVITNGFVPSGAQAVAGVSGSATDLNGEKLVQISRDQLALYPFRRFAAPNRAHLSQEATSAFAEATDTTGRPLLPSTGAQNTSGIGNAITQQWFIDGLPFVPTWSMIGNAVGDADVLMYNSNDIWVWESSLLQFRFEERGGPARIDLALFGYFATRILRPRGLSAVRYNKQV